MYVLSDDTMNTADRTRILAQVSGGCENHVPPYQIQPLPMPMPIEPPEQQPDMHPDHMTLEDYIRQIQQHAAPYMDVIGPLKTQPPL